MNFKKKILIFAAHPDDEVIGCGGTIAKLKKMGIKFTFVFLQMEKVLEMLEM